MQAGWGLATAGPANLALARQGAAGAFAGRGEDRDEDRREKSDDGDEIQRFDQGEAFVLSIGADHHLSGCVLLISEGVSVQA
jgi:hypothetical protein